MKLENIISCCCIGIIVCAGVATKWPEFSKLCMGTAIFLSLVALIVRYKIDFKE